MERETGIEPATNSLEGCDSTTELLPPSRLASFAHSPTTAGRPPCGRERFRMPQLQSTVRQTCFPLPRTSSRREAPRQKTEEALRLASLAQGTIRLDRASPRRACHERGREAPESNGGEGRVRTSVATRAAGLQPAAIDRSATSPNLFVVPPAFAR